MRAASSFAIRAESPARFARAAADSLKAIERPAGAVIFLSGALADSLTEVAAAFEKAPPGAPLLLAAAAGVLTDRGEIEGQSAGAGLVWSGGEADAFVLEGGDPDEVGAELARALRARTERALATALVFAEPRAFSERSLEPLDDLPRLNLFGGGTRADTPVACVSASGKCTTGPLAAMVLRGPQRSIVRFSPACRLLMPLRRVSEVRGPMVLGIDGEPALDVLQSVAADLPNQPLVLVAIAPHGRPPPETGRLELVYRSLQGVDPDRGGVVLSEPVPVGTSLAFAVRDPTAARADLENVARELWRETAGAAPQFAFFLSCAGRGSGLYGSPDIDVRVLRTRFPNLPFAGLHSAFEIAPCAGRPAVQLYSGVIGIFTAPS